MASAGKLANIVINSPCTESWDGMSGDEHKRFCGKCRKHVFNIKELSLVEATALLESGSPICARIYRRPDGSVLTKECGSGKIKRWRGHALMMSLATSLFASFGLKSIAHALSPDPDYDYTVMGGIAPMPSASPTPEATPNIVEELGEVIAPYPTQGKVKMKEFVPVIPKEEVERK